MFIRFYNSILKHVNDIFAYVSSGTAIGFNLWQWFTKHVTLNAILAIITAVFTIIYICYGIKQRKLNCKARELECKERELTIEKERENLKLIHKINDNSNN